MNVSVILVVVYIMFKFPQEIHKWFKHIPSDLSIKRKVGVYVCIAGSLVLHYCVISDLANNMTAEKVIQDLVITWGISFFLHRLHSYFINKPESQKLNNK